MKKIWSKYLTPTPENVAKWLMVIKGVLVTAAATEYFTGNPKTAFWTVIGIGAIHEITTLLTGKDDSTPTT